MQVHQLQCFGTDKGTGNLALVIQNDNFSNEERLFYAKNQNKPVSVFMQISQDKSLINIDFYYPHMQSPLCLHGTLAAAYIYFKQNPEKSKVSVITSMHKQKIDIEKNNDGIFLVMQTQHLNSIDIDDKLLHKLLNASLNITFTNYVIASLGSPKLLIEIDDVEKLYAIKPNLDLIYEFSQQYKVSGIYLYCHSGNGTCYGRNFNHTDSGLEDAATGVAAGALTYYLQQDLTIHQGACLINPCVMRTQYLGTKVMLNGTVLEIFN